LDTNLSLFCNGTASQPRGYSAVQWSGQFESHCERRKSGLWQSSQLALVWLRPAPEIQAVEDALTINIKEEAI